MLSFFFFFRKIFVSALSLFRLFSFSFFFQKDFDTFSMLPFEAFLCFFLMIFMNHFYISIYYKKINSYSLFLSIHKKHFKVFFIGFKISFKMWVILVFFNLLHRNFFYQNLKKFLYHQ